MWSGWTRAIDPAACCEHISNDGFLSEIPHSVYFLKTAPNNGDREIMHFRLVLSLPGIQETSKNERSTQWS